MVLFSYIIFATWDIGLQDIPMVQDSSKAKLLSNQRERDLSLS